MRKMIVVAAAASVAVAIAATASAQGPSKRDAQAEYDQALRDAGLENAENVRGEYVDGAWHFEEVPASDHAGGFTGYTPADPDDE